MRIPNAENAVVEAEKLRDYLLSPNHPIGKFKSAFFRSVGYQAEEYHQLAADFLGLLVGEAEQGIGNKFGETYVVKGVLKGPNGRSAPVVTVWIILAGQSIPRFVTAYPEH